MRCRGYRQGGVILSGVSLMLLCIAAPVAADSFSSTHYKIDASVAAPFGGQASSTDYKMVVSGGEVNANSTSSTSYKLSHGYVAQLQQSIQLSIVQNPVSLGTVTPGVSNTATLTAHIFTDAPSYGLYINQNNNLTNGGNTIPGVSGSIVSPITWTEGTTKGLGFTITGAPTTIDPKWGSSPNYKYAAIPNSSTDFYDRTGFSGGTQDTVTLQPRLDVTSSQVAGNYTNTATLTATIVP
jgi:hypothetical protein